MAAVCVITLLAAAGCGKRTTPVEKGLSTRTLLLGNGHEPADLDPPTATAYTDMNIIMALFEGLTFVDEATTKPVPAAAERWETSADGLQWTFHLRKNATWSNGDPLTAADFVESFRRVVSPRVALENASYLFPLKNAEAINSGKVADLAALGCAAPDAQTLILTLERPTPHLALLTAHTAWYPVNPRVLAKFDAMTSRGRAWTKPGNLVGNGPFTLTEWSPNSRVVVTKNPRYWNAAETWLERIEFFPIEKADAEERSFRTGQLHVTFSLPVTKVAAWRSRDAGKLRNDPFLQTTFVEFNTRKPPFNDPRVRRAFALAIDREAISQHALGGSYAAAYAATPPGTAGYTARARAAFNEAEAKSLLAQAGFAHGAGLPELTLQVRNDEVQPVVAEALQAMWQKTLGVRVGITPLEQKMWLQNQHTLSYTLSTYSWVGDYPDPLTFLGLWVSDNGNNYTGWGDPKYDALVTQASAQSGDARNATFQQAEALLLDACPLTPVYHGSQTYLIDPHVRGWGPALLGSRRYHLLRLE